MSNELENKPEVKSQGSIGNWFGSVKQYLHEVWVEVRPNNGRVTWPTKDSVVISTKVVIASSIFLGLFIGFADYLFSAAYTYFLQLCNSGIG